MSLISAQEARENAEKFSLSADEMLTQVANSISANSKAGNTEIMVGFLAKVVDQSELNFVEKSLKEKGANSNMRCDSLKSLMIINKLSKFL